MQLVNSGNAAIFIALHTCKQLGIKKVLIPKEGGWFSYKHYPKLLDLEVIEVETNWSLLDLEDLKKKADKDSVLLFSTIGGYFVKQDLKQIEKLNIKKIADNTAGYGKLKVEADFEVASFGKNKPANLGYGGMIKSKHQLDETLLTLFKFPEAMQEALQQKINDLPNRWKFLQEKRRELMKLVKNFDIIHKDKFGINIMLKGIDEKAIKILKGNNIPFLICPKYHRVKKKGISIEIKTFNI